MKKYVLYAIGEIPLVVIGILVALQINNWNVKRGAERELKQTYERLILDMEQDIEELNSILEIVEAKRPVFRKFMNDSIGPELLDEGLSRLITTRYITTFNTTGVQHLKMLNVRDSLSLAIIDLYDRLEEGQLKLDESRINDDARNVRNYIRDHHQWFSEWITIHVNKDNSSDELQEFFLYSGEYKNLVAGSYQLIYNNYVPNLETSIERLEELKSKTEIELRRD